MSSKPTFLIPNFDASVKNKVSDFVKVLTPTSLYLGNCKSYYRPAISTTGFRSNVDGTYVFAVKINDITKDSHMFFGFTDVADSASCGYAGNGLSGTSLCCFNGVRSPGDDTFLYLSWAITEKANEIISILIISNNGCKKEILWIVDGNDGPVQDCTKDFGNGGEIFPCASFGGSTEQYVEFVAFDQIKTRSPLMGKLLFGQGFFSPRIQQQTLPSTSVANESNNHLTSSVSLFRLQQDLDKERRRAADLESQLRKEKANAAAKDQQLQRETQNNSWLTTQLRQKDQLVQQQSSEIDRLRQLLKDKH